MHHGCQRLQHKDVPGNTVKDTWDFTEENYKRVSGCAPNELAVVASGSISRCSWALQVELILARYPKNYKQAGIIPLLDLAQRQVRFKGMIRAYTCSQVVDAGGRSDGFALVFRVLCVFRMVAGCRLRRWTRSPQSWVLCP